MAKRRRKSNARARKTIVCRDPETGKSIQFTVRIGGSLSAFARDVHAALGWRWGNTSLTDLRHKRRSPFA